MKTGKITAKLRDAVPVCLMVEGAEVKRYKNIELPDELKEVEMADFHFNVPADGKITFEIHYAPGVLPEVFPEPRTRVTRAAKAAAKTETAPAEEQAPEEIVAEEAEPEQTEAEEMIEAPAEPEAAEETQPAETEAPEQAEEPKATGEEPETMEIAYNVTGDQRKALVTAIGDFIGAKPVYMKAPTYAFTVEDYTIDRNGTLSGITNQALIDALAEQGFTPAA